MYSPDLAKWDYYKFVSKRPKISSLASMQKLIIVVFQPFEDTQKAVGQEQWGSEYSTGKIQMSPAYWAVHKYEDGIIITRHTAWKQLEAWDL